MAHVGTCEVCERQTLNEQIHPECRAAVFEDCLAQVDKLIQSMHPDQGTYAEMTLRIMHHVQEKFCGDHFRTLPEFLEIKNKNDGIEVKQAMWELSLNEHMQHARRKFEKTHPEPKPMRF